MLIKIKFCFHYIFIGILFILINSSQIIYSVEKPFEIISKFELQTLKNNKNFVTGKSYFLNVEGKSIDLSSDLKPEITKIASKFGQFYFVIEKSMGSCGNHYKIIYKFNKKIDVFDFTCGFILEDKNLLGNGEIYFYTSNSNICRYNNLKIPTLYEFNFKNKVSLKKNSYQKMYEKNKGKILLDDYFKKVKKQKDSNCIEFLNKSIHDKLKYLDSF